MSEINDNEIKGIDPSIDTSSRSLPGIDFGSFVSIAVTSSDKQLNSDQVTGDIGKIGDDNKTSSSNPQPSINGDNLTSSTNSLSSQKEISFVDNQDFSQIKSLASFPDLSTTSIVSDSNQVDKSDPIPVDKPDPIKLDEKDKNLSQDSLYLENKTNSDLQPSGSLDSVSQLGSSNPQLVSSDLVSQPSSLDTSIQSSALPNQEVKSVSKDIQNNSQEDRRDLGNNSQNSEINEISSAINPVDLSPENKERTTSNDDDPFSTAIPDIDIVFSNPKIDQNSQPKPESKPDQEIDLILGKGLDLEKISSKQVEESRQNQPQDQTPSQDQNQDLRVFQDQQSEQNVALNPEPQISQDSQPNPESKIDLLQQDSLSIKTQQIIQQNQEQDQPQNLGQNLGQNQEQGQIKTDLDPLKDLPTTKDNQQNQKQIQDQNPDNQQTQDKQQNPDNQQTQDKQQNPDNQQTQNNQQIETQDTGQQILNLPSSADKQLPSYRQQITSVVDGKELDPNFLKLFKLTQTAPDQQTSDQLGVGESISINDLREINVDKIKKETRNDTNKKDSNDQNQDSSINSSSISIDQKPSSSESDLSSKQEVSDQINSSEYAKKFVDKVKNKEDESAKKIQGFFQRLFKRNVQKTTENVNIR